jgi:hypothetical protein
MNRRSSRDLTSKKNTTQHEQKGKRKKHQNVSQVDGEPSEEELFLKQKEVAEKELLKELGGKNTPVLQSAMSPSEPFIADDFLCPYDRYDKPAQKELPDPVQHAAEQQALEEARLRRRRARTPRMAFRRLAGRETGASDGPVGESSPTVTSPVNTPGEGSTPLKEHVYMTTPLHEAARLGAADFVRFLLANSGDPNVRNGLSRTSIHTCAGGLTAEEDRLLTAMTTNKKKQKKKQNTKTSPSTEEMQIGIRAASIPEEISKLMHDNLASADGTEPDTGGNNVGRRGILGRLFRSKNETKKNEGPRNDIAQSSNSGPVVRPNPDRLDELITERMDAMLALLSWVQKDTGDGPSINAVDADGRTGLHYAAEMGRSGICMAILSNFGAMLTIVDELGARTPCELAASQGHHTLAAQLEARALLYIDPYGLDDDLMENMLSIEENTSPRNRLVPPFKWFRTMNIIEVSQERSERLAETRSKMLLAVEHIESSKQSATGNDTPLADKIETGDTQSQSSRDEDELEGEKPASIANILECNGVLSNEDAEKNMESSTQTMKLEADGVAKLATDYFPDSCEDSEAQTCLREMFMNLQDSHAERFLAFHKWDVSTALKAFRKDPIESFSNAGVPVPKKTGMTVGKTGDRTCKICYDDDVEKENWMQLKNCEHGFCRDCLVDFVKDCAKDKMPIHLVACPHHQCSCVFCQSDVQELLKDDPGTLERLNCASTEQFVLSCLDFKFCPHPGCEGVVHRLPQATFTNGGFDAHFLDCTGATCVAISGENKIGDGCTLTYEGVEDLDYNNCHSLKQPPKAHRFCFACGESVHWPVTCQRLEEWNQIVKDEIGEVNDESNGADFNELAQKMWLKANTRPCPECNVPIEKNDGCNHM